MAFAVEDFHDLIRLLGEHPDWQAELRRHVLTDGLLGLPAQFARLAERWDERFAALVEAQARTEERLERLVEAQARTEERLQRVELAVERLAQALLGLTLAQKHMESRAGRLEGQLLEIHYERRAGAYFGPLARRLRVIESTRLADLLDDAVDGGQLADAERRLVLLADLVLTGRRRPEGDDVYLLVEVSKQVDPGDVARAAHRGGLLARLGRPVMPVVAGQSITEEAAAMATAQGVWQVLDGRETDPSGDA